MNNKLDIEHFGAQEFDVNQQVTRSLLPSGDGLLIIDKPLGLSSSEVVSRVRRFTNTKKVGHGGTLDPGASGVLICAIGRATRFLHYLLGHDKTYLAKVRFGIGTNTDDAQGEIISRPGLLNLDSQTLQEALNRWTGQVEQVPASVSAIKIAGQRAYDKVRKGQSVDLKARPVTIKRLELLTDPVQKTIDGTPVVEIDIEVECSSGTYIRALARDLGKDLATAGHLCALRRTRVGPFNLDQAVTLNQLDAQVKANNQDIHPKPLQLISIFQASKELFAIIEITEEQKRALCYGQKPQLTESQKHKKPQAIQHAQDKNHTQDTAQIFAAHTRTDSPKSEEHSEEELIALVKIEKDKLSPICVFAQNTGNNHAG